MDLFQRIKEAIETAVLFVRLEKIFKETTVTPKGEYFYNYCLSMKNDNSTTVIDTYEKIIDRVSNECEVDRQTAIELILSMFDYVRAKNL